LLPSAGPWRSIGAAGCAKQIGNTLNNNADMPRLYIISNAQHSNITHIHPRLVHSTPFEFQELKAV
jgi:hypothetical protein